MSQVDSRIVKMEFDNKQFEAGCKKTLSTLSNLKESLNFKGAGDSLKKLSSQMSSLPLDAISKGMESVTNRFSAWGIATEQIIRRVTDGAINAGKTIATAMTIDPVKTGFQEYETQINAVQTILANTQSKGTTIDQVNDALDELNHYADKTIYNFTEMTRNIGTFTAAGIDLDTSVTAIQGIANLAAVSGSTSNQASVAMYQLSQALAAGTVKLQDWNSVVNAGMGGQVFQDTLKETAREMGIAVDEMIEKEGSFRESLSKGWLTSEVLTKTLAKFTDETTELGRTATDAATKVKTFTQLWDTMKEAVQSGWTETWEIIIGDFEEAKATLTNVNNFIDGLIQSYNEARNTQLRFWKDNGGRDKLIKALTNAVEALKTVVIPVGQAFKNMVPSITGKRILAVTDAFVKFTENMKLGSIEMGKVYAITQGFLSIFKSANIIISLVIKALAPATEKILPTLLTIVAKIASSFTAFSEELSKNTSLFEIFRDVVYTVRQVFEAFSKAFRKQFPSIGKSLKSGTSIVFKLLSAVNKLTGSFIHSIATADGFNALFKGANGIISVFKMFVSIIQDVIDGFQTSGKSVTSFTDILLDVVAVVGDLLSFISEFIQKSGIVKMAVKTVSAALSVLANVITTVISKVTGLIRKIADFITSNSAMKTFLSAVKTAIEKLGDAFVALKDRVVETFKAIANSEGVQNLKTQIERLWTVLAPIASDAFTKATNNLTNFINAGSESASFSNFVNLVSKMADGIANFISVLASGGDPLEKIRGGLDALLHPFESIAKLYRWLQGVMKNGIVGTSLKEISSAVSNLVNDDILRKVGDDLAKFFDSIGSVITSYDWGSIVSTIVKVTNGLLGLKVLQQLFNTLKTAQTAISSIGGMFTSIKQLANTAKNAIRMDMFKSFAASMLMLSGALWIIAQIPTNRLLDSIGTLSTCMLELVGVIALLQLPIFNEKKMAAMGGMFLGLGLGLLSLIGSIALLSFMSLDTLKDGMEKLVSIVLMLGVASRIAGKQRTASGFIGIAVAVDLLVPAVFALGHMDSRKALRGVAAVEALVIGLGVASRIAGKQRTASGFIGIAVAVDLLAIAVKVLGDMETKKAIQGVLAVEAIMLGLAVSARIAGKNGPSLKTMIGFILEIAVAAGSIYLLAQLPIANAIAAASSLSAVILVVAAASRIASGSFQSVIVMGLVLAETVAALWILTKLDTSALKIATTGLAETLLSVSAALALLSLARVNISSAIDAVGGFALFFGGILGLLAVIAKIQEAAGTDIAEYVRPAVEVFEVVGEAIGSFVGGVLSGILEALDPLTMLGEAMENFWNHASVFFDGVSNMPEGVGEGVKTVAEAMFAFLGAEAIQGIMNNPLVKALMGGTNPLEDFIEMLADMVEPNGSLTRFISCASGLSDDAVDTAGHAADIIAAIAAAATKIPNTGGLLGDIVGNNDIDDFMEMCADMAPDMRSYVRSVQGFTEEDKTQSKLAMEILSTIIEVADDIPNTGGWLGDIVGNNDIDDFVNMVANMAPDMRSYLRQVNNDAFNETSLKRSDTLMECLSNIIKQANDIPNSGLSVVSFFVGDNAINDFCGMLPDTAKYLRKYFAAIGPGEEGGGAISRSDVVRSGLCMEALAAILEQANNIPRVDADWLAALFGSDDITAFTAGLEDVAHDLLDYMDVIKDIPSDAISNSTVVMEALDGIVSLANTISTYGDERLDSFGDNLSAMGSGLKDYIADISTISADDISHNADIIDMILDIDALKESITQYGDERLDSFGDNIRELGMGLISYYHQIESIDADVLMTKQSLVASLVKAVENLIEDGGFKDMDNAASSLTNFGNSYTEYYNDVKSIDNNTITKVCNSINKIIDSFVKMKTVDLDTVKSFGDTMFAVSNAGCTRFINRFKGTHEEVEAAISGYINAAAQACSAYGSDLSTDFYNLGVNIAIGFENGINDQLPDTKTTIYDFGMECLDVLKEAFDSHSPSRETIKIGTYFGEGLSNGISGMIPDVMKVVSLVGSSALDGLSAAFKPIDRVVNSGLAIDTSIRPVYDMSGLQYGNRQISSALNQESIKMAETNGRYLASSINDSMNNVELDNSDIVSAIEKLQSDVVSLNDNLAKMQIVMDTGAVVGQIATPLDYEYGRRTVYASRRN